MNYAHIVLQHDKEPYQVTVGMHHGSRFLSITLIQSVYYITTVNRYSLSRFNPTFLAKFIST